MAPIRVALIGLSASAKTSWAAEGHLPYLLSPTGRSKYTIVALLNSSVSAAQSAIQTYGLPSATRAYGDPVSLAQDPSIDLVVCNTRVDVHYESIKPSIEAEKAVFVEWPLAANVSQARELEALAKEKGVRTVVGLQNRFAPPVLKVQELLKEGAIGAVLSSEAKGYSRLLARDWLPDGLAYFADRKVGGSPVTIHMAHMIDFIHTTLGEYSTFHAHAQIRHPTFSLISTSQFSSTPSLTPSTPAPASSPTITSTVPDLVSIHGTLTSGASLLLNFQNGPPFPSDPAFVWTIVGTKGDIRITSPLGPSPLGPYLPSDPENDGVTIELHDFETDKVESVGWEWSEMQKGLWPVKGRVVGDVYERFAEGRDAGNGWPGFAGAVKRHEELDEVFRMFDEQQK